jgi:hypothetical protein
MIGTGIAVIENVRAVDVSNGRERKQQNTNESDEFLHRLLKTAAALPEIAKIAKKSKIENQTQRVFILDCLAIPAILAIPTV